MKDSCCILRILHDILLLGGERLFMRLFKCSRELTNINPSTAELFTLVSCSGQVKFFAQLFVPGAFWKRNIHRLLVDLITELQVFNLSINNPRGRNKLP